MNKKTIHRIKIFLINQLLEPWTEKISLPNSRTIFFILILIFSILKNWTFLLISIAGDFLFYEIHLFKSGEYIHWYRDLQKRANRKRKDKTGSKCIFYKDGKCNSDYASDIKCDGISVPVNCPYQILKNRNI
jgi:hypothetical protein